MLKLNRNHIYLITVFLFILVVVGGKLFRYLTEDTCTCRVEKIEYVLVERSTGGGSKFSVRRTYLDNVPQPFARCHTESLDFLAAGPVNSRYNIGESVSVLYSSNSLGNAVFLTWRFWFPYYPLLLVALFVLSIGIYSFISKSQFLIIRFNKKDAEKFIELTPAEKDPMLVNRLKKARQAMFQNRRR